MDGLDMGTMECYSTLKKWNYSFTKKMNEPAVYSAPWISQEKKTKTT